MGRYTYLGLTPFSTISGRGNEASVERAGERPQSVTGKPLELVQAWMSEYRSPKVDGLPKFVGGIAGFWSYDVARSIERLSSVASADLSVPDYAFMMLDELWVLDHTENRLYCAVHQPWKAGLPNAQLQARFDQAAGRAAEMKQTWDAIIAASRANELAMKRRNKLAADIADHNIGIEVELLQDVQAAFSREEYMLAVERIQDYIRDGDVFQVNLSVRQSMKLDSSPARIYEWLRHLNPSPYMGYLSFKEYQLVSGSPELLVQVDGDRVRTRPIAGTRPRGASAEEDEQLVQKLLNNEKERAEHIMLVDLERNDLGRISRYGTVRVDELMAVEKYSHVMHIVSEITGELKADKDAFDVIAATFPGGTITGAPKIRTMEIIEELEPVRRGPYTGSIGWIDYNGNMEFNIIIRTMLAEGGIGYIQAGAGIVIDSDPAREYTESLNKAKAMWKAVQYASTEENQ
jgi:para-aminobenzoate synthetase component I